MYCRLEMQRQWDVVKPESRVCEYEELTTVVWGHMNSLYLLLE